MGLAAGCVVVGVIAGVAVTLAVLCLLRRRSSAPTAGAGPLPSWPAATDTDEIARLRQNLRLKTLHNESLIDRLVQAERERSPGATEVDWYRAAIERLERDNR